MGLIKKTVDYFKQFIGFIWSLFLQGLLTILPIILTLALFNVSFRLLKSWLEPVQKLCPAYLTCIPHAEIFIAIIIIFLIGTIIKVFMLRSLVHAMESILLKVPIIRTVYRGIQQLVSAFNPQDQITFKEVVLLEFPKELNEECEQILNSTELFTLFLKEMVLVSNIDAIAKTTHELGRLSKETNKTKTDFAKTYNLDLSDFTPGDSPQEYIQSHIYSGPKGANLT